MHIGARFYRPDGTGGGATTLPTDKSVGYIVFSLGERMGDMMLNVCLIEY